VRRCCSLLLLPLLLLPVAACSSPSFEAPSLVDSVRVLATRADTPYAAPGASVQLELLTVDGRASAAEPMHVSWLPAACINPAGDAYYGCFPAFADQFQRGVELDSQLVSGDAFSFTLPSDIVTSHASGLGEAYGLAVAFSIACAGHVEYRPAAAGGPPDAVPFACVDGAGRLLGADQFVFAYSLVYSFESRRNENPELHAISYAGAPIDPSLGLTLEHCRQASIDDCPANKLDVDVPASSQELDPSNQTAAGSPLHESLYVQYFATGGKIANDTVVIFDPRAGRLAHTGDDFRAPQSPGEYRLWAVVHDNRGGTTWQEVALHVQ